jgi:hypothetical protein
MIDEILDQLTAVAIVLAFLALIGFAGWITEPADIYQRVERSVSGVMK